MSENPRSPGPVDGQHRPGQTGTPGTPGPVPGRPGITPGPESAHQPLEASEPGEPAPDSIPELPRLQQPRRGRRLAKKPEEPASPLTAEQRLLVLDAWQRSGLSARDFAPLTSVTLSRSVVGADERLGRAVSRVYEDDVLWVTPRRIDREEDERLLKDVGKRVDG